jgi:hypothetical protein
MHLFVAHLVGYSLATHNEGVRHMKVPVTRVMAFISSVILLSLSSLILSGYGSWPQSVAGFRLFPLPESDLVFDSNILRVSKGERSVRIQTDDSLTVSFQLSTSSDDAVVSDVTAGKFRDFPEVFIGHYFGGLSASDGSGGVYVRFRWTAPMVERTEGGRAVITAKGESRTTNGRLELRAMWATCAHSGCRPDVVVAGSKRIAAVDPPSGISKQNDRSLELQSQPLPLSITFDDGAPPELTKLVDLPPSVWSTLEGLWRQVLDPVLDQPGHAQIMRDHQDGHAGALLQFHQEVQDAGLHGDVQRAGGFVRRQQVRVTAHVSRRNRLTVLSRCDDFFPGLGPLRFDLNSHIIHRVEHSSFTPPVQDNPDDGTVGCGAVHGAGADSAPVLREPHRLPVG